MPSTSGNGPRLAFGPAMPGWGSWEWVGLGLVQELTSAFPTTVFSAGEVPDADIVFVIKHPPSAAWLARLAASVKLVFCPLDFYPNAETISADAQFLRRCARIIVHCERLRPFFDKLAPVVYLDHPIKFATPLRKAFQSTGDLLWVGVRSNLPPLVEWVNRHPLLLPLDVLTNFEDPNRPPTLADFGFRPALPIQLHNWSAERQVELTRRARAALDIKGDDFRSRHKPPAKAIDFIASGLPLAMNRDSSPVEHLARYGLAVADPLDSERWLSKRYWQETMRSGRRLRRQLTSALIGAQFRRLIAAILADPSASVSPSREAVPASKRRRSKVTNLQSLDREARRNLDRERLKYEESNSLAVQGRVEEALTVLGALRERVTERSLSALIRNDLGALAAQRGDQDAALHSFREALTLDPECAPARANLALLDEAPHSPPSLAAPLAQPPAPPRVKLAILSFLFNWPSTGGGIVHTVELALFLGRAGYDVRHFHVRFPPWKIGDVTAALPFSSEALTFDDAQWNAAAIQDRFRAAVAAFAPDFAILTDSWNFKPLLAEAVREWPYLLRLQALECLCPLNNVRLLPEPEGRVRQCGLHQLATPEQCVQCVRQRGSLSGALHQAERDLSGVGTPDYPAQLRRAFAEAEAVLVVNPLAEAMVSPYARVVRVVTAGMDPARFPWPPPTVPRGGKKVILFAGLVDEWMKGFHVVHSACQQLWRQRQDFELVATADPVGSVDAFTRFIGWQTQEDLPKHLWNCSALVMPTIAQEALGRTAVEAMAAGRPVVASRLGGLSFTVADGATGLLFEPGDADDLARKLTALLDDEGLCERLGQAGRRRFEEHYTWPVIIEKHYRRLLRSRAVPACSSTR
jgi:glycosyltransferase involved in cell wall biosynthesis